MGFGIRVFDCPFTCMDVPPFPHRVAVLEVMIGSDKQANIFFKGPGDTHSVPPLQSASGEA
jgi:hypothetical protein